MSVFPPTKQTNLTKAIPAYPYEQYNDDSDIGAFFDAYNNVAQQYIDAFNNLNLPIYTSLNPLAIGAYLDFIGNSIYGYPRPVISSSNPNYIGAFNTLMLNEIAFNADMNVGTNSGYAVSDDIYQRCLTWHFYRGDGFQFTTFLLKRKIQRFLVGAGGAGLGICLCPDVNINHTATLTTITITNSSSYPSAPSLAALVYDGLLQLPFDFTYTVNLT